MRHPVLQSWIFLVVIAALAAGCASQIHVLSPTAGVKNNPVSEVVVSFGANFNPSEWWTIQLDGTPLAGFSPAPTPGGVSRASLPPFTQGINGSSKHTITAQAGCGMFCVYPSEEVDIYPPQLFYNGTGEASVLPIRQFVTTPIFVGVQNPPSTPIFVTIAEKTKPYATVQLGLLPSSLLNPGIPLNVTIPPGSTRGLFYVQGQAQGYCDFVLTAVGTTPGVADVHVVP